MEHIRSGFESFNDPNTVLLYLAVTVAGIIEKKKKIMKNLLHV